MPTPPRNPNVVNRGQQPPPQRAQAPRGQAPVPQQRGVIRPPQAQMAQRTFVYRRRSDESVVEQRNRQTSRWDLPMVGIGMFKPKTGENMIRILPPTWQIDEQGEETKWQIDKQGKEIQHYAYQVFLHKFVGANRGTYPCLREMKGEPCPMCEQAQALSRSGNTDDAFKMGYKEAWLLYLIDRKAEMRDTPVVWSISKIQDNEITGAARGFTNKTLAVDDPDAGHDLRFQKTLLNPNDPITARYSLFQYSPDGSPISDNLATTNEILLWLQANPIPNMIRYYTAEYMEEQLMGTAAAHDETLDDGYDQNQQADSAYADDPRYADAQYAQADGDGQADQGDGYDPETAGQGNGQGEVDYVAEAVAEATAEGDEAAQAAVYEEEDPVVTQPARPTQVRRPIVNAAPRAGNSAPRTQAPRQQAPRAAVPAAGARRPAPQGRPPQRGR